MRSTQYEPGAPVRDRPKLFEAIDERIRSIEAEHEAIVNSAASLTPPITIERLEPVRQRRQAEAVRREREERAHELAHGANAGMHRRQHAREAERERAREAAARLEAARREEAEREAAKQAAATDDGEEASA